MYNDLRISLYFIVSSAFVINYEKMSAKSTQYTDLLTTGLYTMVTLVN